MNVSNLAFLAVNGGEFLLTFPALSSIIKADKPSVNV